MLTLSCLIGCIIVVPLAVLPRASSPPFFPTLFPVPFIFLPGKKAGKKVIHELFSSSRVTLSGGGLSQSPPPGCPLPVSSAAGGPSASRGACVGYRRAYVGLPALRAALDDTENADEIYWVRVHNYTGIRPFFSCESLIALTFITRSWNKRIEITEWNNRTFWAGTPHVHRFLVHALSLRLLESGIWHEAFAEESWHA